VNKIKINIIDSSGLILKEETLEKSLQTIEYFETHKNKWLYIDGNKKSLFELSSIDLTCVENIALINPLISG